MEGAETPWSLGDETPCGTDMLQTLFEGLTVASGNPHVNLQAYEPSISEIPIVTDDDKHKPCISFMVTTKDNQLWMIDSANSLLKTVSLTDPVTITPVKLSKIPRRLAGLANGDIALTTTDRVLLFIIAGVCTMVQTSRCYGGISEGPEGTLIVSCKNDSDGPGCLDMIQPDGTLVRTVVLEANLPWTVDIVHLSVVNNHVLILDTSYCCVHRVDLDDGKIVDTITHADLVTCVEAAQDKKGFMYFLCFGKQYIRIRTPQGCWGRILESTEPNKNESHCPLALSLSQSRMIVSWVNALADNCAVYMYDF